MQMSIQAISESILCATADFRKVVNIYESENCETKRGIRKNNDKIAYLQDKNKKLSDKIRRLENEEIIAAVRESGFTIDELLNLLGKNEETPKIENDLEENDNEI